MILKKSEMIISILWGWWKHTWIIHSMRYSCAMASLQLTTCSKIAGRTTWHTKYENPLPASHNICGFFFFLSVTTLMARHVQAGLALTVLYLSKVTPSSCDRTDRLVPTRIFSSRRSFSLLSFSLVWPWCCIRTQSLFISAKFRRMKSRESCTGEGCNVACSCGGYKKYQRTWYV